MNELRRDAGRLLEQAQRYDEAFALYQSAKDWESISRLALAQAQALIAQGRGETLREWIQSLPAEVLERKPWLSYWQGISLLDCSPGAAKKPLEHAYWRLRDAQDANAQVMCCSALLVAHLSDLTDFRPLDAWIERLNQLLEDSPKFHSPVVELQANAALANLGHVRKMRGAFYAPAVKRALELLETDIAPNDKIVPACILLHALREAGCMKDCARVTSQLQPWVHAASITPASVAYWYQLQAWIATSAGDRVAAAAARDKADEICREHAISGASRHVYTHMISGAIAFQTGNLAGAEHHVKQIETYLSPQRWLERGWASWINSIVASMRNDWQGAIDCAQRELDFLSDAGAVFHLYYAHLHMAGGLIGLQRFREAHEQIENARAVLTGTFEFRNLADVDLMAAWLALNQDEMQRFDECVREAFALLRRTELHACLWYVDQRILPAVLARALQRGVEVKQVSDYVRDLKLQPPPDAPAQWPWPIKIFALGRFEVLREDAPLESSRKPAKKPLALLKLIVCAGGAPLPVAHALDALWPESEADAAEKAFDVALHRLRALLGVPDAVKLADGRLTLDRARVWVDAWQFEASCREDNAEHAAALYRGALLPDELDAPWSVSYREKLHDSFNRLIRAQAARLEARQRYDEALTWYTRGLQTDDLVEAMYQGQMRCHLQLGQRADALAAFARLRRTLSSKLRTTPSAESAALAQQAQG